MRIWKYPLARWGEGGQTVELPVGAKVVACRMETVDPEGFRREPTMWMMVDPKAAPQGRTFQVFPTGVDIPPLAVYVGTVFEDIPTMAPLVWHIFEVTHVDPR